MIAVRSPNQHCALPRSARTRNHGAATSSCTRRPHHSAPPPRVFHSHLALGTTLIMATAGGVVEPESWWLASDVEQWKACRRLSVLDQYEPPEHRARHGPDAFKSARRKRRARNAKVIAAAQAAAAVADRDALPPPQSYGLRSHTGASEKLVELCDVPMSASRKRDRYAGATQPTAQQRAAFQPTVELPPFDDRLPSYHCGGDLYFTSLVLAEPALCHCRTGAHRHPYFLMMAGAAALFESATLTHGTAQHEPVRSRSKGCAAHLSIAAQLPGDLLPDVARDAAASTQLHAELMAAMSLDANAKWGDDADTVWLAVHVVVPPEQSVRLAYNEQEMCVLPFARVVLYDAAAEPRKRVLVVYDKRGGLSSEEQARVRGQFDFMHYGFRFDLQRQTSSTARGALGYDGGGKQRMEMLGVHNRRYNKGKKGGPDKIRPGHRVRNAKAPLDAYVRHFDDPHFGREQMKWLMNALSSRMHAALPSTYGRLRKALEDADMRSRVFSEDADDFVSDDWVCANIGLSAAYQSPPHCDQNDMGPCMAVAIKCPVRECMHARAPARECKKAKQSH